MERPEDNREHITLKTPHLAASLIALGIAAAVMCAGVITGTFLERRYIHVLAPILSPQKNQVVALQKLAFNQSDLLPIYGSSELVKPSANRCENNIKRIVDLDAARSSERIFIRQRGNLRRR